MAKPSPILIAILCPATTTAPNTTCMTKPITSPTAISRRASSTPRALSGSTAGGAGSSGAISAAMARARIIRTRVVICVELNTGAASSSADTRRNGHRYRAIWASRASGVTGIG